MPQYGIASVQCIPQCLNPPLFRSFKTSNPQHIIALMPQCFNAFSTSPRRYASFSPCVNYRAQVLFDPKETTYENLLRIFFGRHDPTQVDGQGNDKGTQYRAGVYFHDDEQVGEAPPRKAWTTTEVVFGPLRWCKTFSASHRRMLR